jgi:two-component system OmpR family sensor kinase
MSDFPQNALECFLDRLERGPTDEISPSEISQATVAVAAETLEADMCVLAENENGGLDPVVSQPADWTDTDGFLSPASFPSIIASSRISYLIADRSDVRGASVTASHPEATSTTLKSALVVPFGEEKVLLAGNNEASTFSDADLEHLRLLSRFATVLYEKFETGSIDDHPHDRVTEAASTLSHDGKNYLTIIQGRVELARTDPRPEHFDAIERGCQRLAELIEDTRLLLETGSQATDLEAVQLHDVVQEAWKVEQSADAALWIAPLGTVVAERSRLCQILENLFRNAVTHAGPDVTLKVGMLSEEQGFFVEDDGPGIEPNERESIFKFAYAESEESGIGLNIVQWIATAHEWDISIERGEMGGTRFEFSGVEIVQ